MPKQPVIDALSDPQRAEGGYHNSTQAVHHSFAVIATLLTLDGGSVHFLREHELEEFNILGLGNMIRVELTLDPDQTIDEWRRSVFPVPIVLLDCYSLGNFRRTEAAREICDFVATV